MEEASGTVGAEWGAEFDFSTTWSESSTETETITVTIPAGYKVEVFRNDGVYGTDEHVPYVIEGSDYTKMEVPCTLMTNNIS